MEERLDRLEHETPPPQLGSFHTIGKQLLELGTAEDAAAQTFEKSIELCGRFWANRGRTCAIPGATKRSR